MDAKQQNKALASAILEHYERTRKCSRCGNNGPFNKNEYRSSGLQSLCIKCQADFHKAWYEKHKEQRKQQIFERRKRIQEEVQHLKQQPCFDCGRSFPPWCMDYDHRIPSEKTANITDMIRSGNSMARILLEIEKCDLVCAVCHRDRTHRRGEDE